MNIIIREYKMSDEGGVKRCIGELKKFESQFDPDYFTSEDSIEKLFSDIKNGKIFVAESENGIVAFISVVIENKNDELIVSKVDTVYISDFVVLPECRGMGIGHKLVKEVENFARTRNIKYLKLRVFSESEKTVGFYHELGFFDYETTMLKELK